VHENERRLRLVGFAAQFPDNRAPTSEATMTISGQKRDSADLERLRQEVNEEFGRLKPRLRSMIEKRIAPRLRGRMDVDLILEKALSGLLKSIESKAPSSNHELHSWIFKKVWSRWQDELRRWKATRRDANREEDLPSGSDVAFVRGIGIATDLCVKEVVDRIRGLLGPLDFVIVELRIVDEMPFAELAELVGLKVDTVSKRFSRALLKIRNVIPSPFSSSW
jgi:RNA polymerase sigma factor (sigma-70 family)